MNRRLPKLFLSFALAFVLALGVVLVRPVETAAATDEEPLMRIAMFADLHVEFGLQDKEKPIRFSIAKAAKYARDLTGGEGVDVVLVGGDMTGARGGWTQKKIDRTVESVFDYMSGVTKDGKVMLVTGNHDPEPSANISTKEGERYSGDYSEAMKENCGEFVSSLYVSEIGASLSPYQELLCYRYTVNGIEFIGLNTPYVENQATVSGLYAEQTQWLKAEMEKIGTEKTVFLFCHYPYSSVSTITDPRTYASVNSCRSDLQQVLQNYPNTVYCYGHVHSGDTWWAKTNTADIVRPQGSATLVDKGVYKTKSFINAHMGSMGYYNNEYQPGGLTSADPLVVQFVMIELYANRIEFQVHNTGNKVAPGGTREIRPLIIARDLSAQFGLDPSEGVYQKGDADKSTASTDTASSASDPSTDTTDASVSSTLQTTAPATDSGSGNLLPIVILLVLGVILVAAVAVAVVMLKKGKPSGKDEA